MTATDMTLEGAGALAGGRLGQVLGGLIGGLFGPEAIPLGVIIGGRVGAIAGRAAGAYIASQMEQANEDVEKKTTAEDAATPCLNCGEIECFTPPEGANQKEFNDQLKRQQDTINNMKPDDLLNNMQRYQEIGRGAGDAKARKQVREDWLRDRTAELRDRYVQEKMSRSRAEAKAKDVAAREAKTLDAVHDLDGIAGGGESGIQMGDRSANRSIGPQWKGKKVAQLKKHAEEAQKQGKKMNVELKNCNEEGGTPTS